MRLETKIHPQYIDRSKESEELQACVKLIDAIVTFQKSTPKSPACLQRALQWCNERSSEIMNAMDAEGQDRKSYSDTQDRESYSTKKG